MPNMLKDGTTILSTAVVGTASTGAVLAAHPGRTYARIYNPSMTSGVFLAPTAAGATTSSGVPVGTAGASPAYFEDRGGIQAWYAKTDTGTVTVTVLEVS